MPGDETQERRRTSDLMRKVDKRSCQNAGKSLAHGENGARTQQMPRSAGVSSAAKDHPAEPNGSRDHQTHREERQENEERHAPGQREQLHGREEQVPPAPGSTGREMLMTAIGNGLVEVKPSGGTERGSQLRATDHRAPHLPHA